MAINFTLDQKFTFSNRLKTKAWIKNIISLKGKQCGDISYVFVSDSQELALNKQYLNHDYLTDIITFDYVENDIISGDIFISVDRVKENAIAFEQSFDRELHRVIIHGVLHLLGYEDHNPEDEKIMRLQEDWALKIYYQDN